MVTVIDQIQAKVTRAEQHIQDLQLGLRAFRDTTPYAVAIKEDTQAGKRIYYVSKAEDVPFRLTAIAADAIQNLRSPLDQIAHQLVLDARGGRAPERKVYYPIRGSAADYLATRSAAIKGVRQEIVDAIDATEPYKGGKGNALWQLNELNKSDKHRLLIGAGAFFSGVDVSVDFGNMPGFENVVCPQLFLAPADKLLALKVGDELFIEPLIKKVAENRRFTFDVSLNAPSIIEPEPALKVLQDMTNLVGHIVGTLSRFLP